MNLFFLFFKMMQPCTVNHKQLRNFDQMNGNKKKIETTKIPLLKQKPTFFKRKRNTFLQNKELH